MAGMLGGPAPARGAIYDYEAIPDSSETYTTALFRIHVPDAPHATLRGVYFFVSPYNSDSRYIVADAAFQALTGDVDFALMGARLDNVNMDSGIGDALLEALDAFAILSGHGELRHAPLYFEGYSWGGQWSYHFTKWRPDRVIGFVTQKGGYHDTSPAGEAILVPGYLFIGELDLPYRIENLTGIFETHRPLGARWILAMQPGAGHSPITDRLLLDEYFHAVIEGRLPETIDPEEPVALRTLVEQTAYLGNRETHEIGYYPCYNADAGLASWCPRRSVAGQWQAFVSDGAVTDTLPCDPAAVEDSAWPAPGGDRSGGGENLAVRSHGTALRPTLSVRPNPILGGGRLHLSLSSVGAASGRAGAVPAEGSTISPSAGLRDVSLWTVCGRLLHRWDLGAGREAHWNWDGCDQRGARVPAGVYLLRVGGAGWSCSAPLQVLR